MNNNFIAIDIYIYNLYLLCTYVFIRIKIYFYNNLQYYFYVFYFLENGLVLQYNSKYKTIFWNHKFFSINKCYDQPCEALNKQRFR